MKFKLIFAALLLIAAMSFQSASAQVAVTLPYVAADSVVNTATTSKIITVTTGISGIHIQANVLKKAGTVGGTLGLFASEDGTNYVQIGSNQTVLDVTGTQGYVWTVTAPVPQYLKVLQTGAGTMAAVLTVKYRAPKYQPSN